MAGVRRPTSFLFPSSPSQPDRPATPTSRHQANESTSTSASSALSFTLSSRDSYASTAFTEDWECDTQSDSLSLYDAYYTPTSSTSQVQHVQELLHDDEDALERLSGHSLPSARSSRSKRVASSAAPPTDFARLLASLQSSSLGRCMCGREPEEDSIYCGRQCAQADALQALCSSSASDDASIKSSSTGNSAGSHYRRVEREEKERAYQQQKEKERAAEQRQARTGAWTNGLNRNGSTSSAKQSTRPLPPRTSSRRNPSASSTSSIPSLSASTSSSASSARSACSTPSPYDDHPTHAHLFIDAPSSPFPERNTPSPALGQPRKQHLIDAEATPTLAHPGFGPGRSFTDEEYGVPSADQHSKSGLGHLGMMMLQVDDDDNEDFGEEQGDRVVSFSEQRGKELKERVIRGRGGHARGKLSFDDVLSVMRG